MSGKNKSTAGNSARYKRYQSEGKYATNKKAKLDRHLAKFPNDTIAKAARQDVKAYRRRAAQGTQWSHQEIADQKLFVAAAVKIADKAQVTGGDVRKIREKAITEVAKHQNQSTKQQKSGGEVIPNRAFKTNIFELGQRVIYV